MTPQGRLVSAALVVGLSFLMIESASSRGGQTPDLISLSDADLLTLTIQLERAACYGTCPGYTVTIHGDGRVEYSGKIHVKESGAREGRIEPDRIRALAAELGKIKFWEIADKYSVEKCRGRICTDFAAAITEVSVKGLTHRVVHYYGCGSAPKSLFDVETAIDKSVNSERWTGDVSKAGPFGTTCSNK